MAPPIPDRWIPYKACGRVIEGTRLICFKVPLRKGVQVGKSEIKEIWDIPALLAKIPNLGAVIDLTNTSRYYDPRELQAAGVLHSKILMPGRVVPPEPQVQLFMDTVDEFLGKDCDFLIGVHCTHGLNRTGYMVCRYMRDRLNIPPHTAIKRFEKARGYEIERKNYIAELLGEKLPPPDLGKHTELKPVAGKSRNSPQKDEAKNRDNLGRRDRGKDKYSEGKRSSEECNGDWRSEPRDGVNGEEKTISNWRDEPRDNRSWRSGACSEKFRSETSRNVRGSSWKKNRTDSESSYDFRHDY